jgi:hypothetical protein
MSDITDSATRVAGVMARVLGLDEVAVDEDFFGLGGNSLDVGRLCAELAGPNGLPVPFGQVYRTATARGLAAFLDGRGATPETALGIARTVPGEPVPLTRGQANLAQAGDEVVCVLAWWLTGALDLDALRAALGDVHARHETLHCRYLRENPPVAVLPDGAGTPQVTVLGAYADPAAAEEALERTVGAPLAIAEGQVWRAVVVPTPDPERSLFGIGIHHVAFDGWSQALLIADLDFAYQARLAGDAPLWTASVPGLVALAAEEADRLAGVDLAGQVDYWRGVLRRVRRVDLPGGLRGPVPPTGPRHGHRAHIPADVLAEWDGYARSRRVTPFGYLVAVFGQLLRELTGQREVAMMVPVAARGTPLLDVAVAARLDAVCLHLVAGPGDPVERAGAVLSAALAAQDLPFSAAVTAVAQLRPDVHVLATLPVFLLQDNDSNPLTLAGCAAEAVDSPVAREAPNTLTAEVFRDTAGATVRVTVRSDRVPAELAEAIATGFARILTAGPAALAGPAPARPDAPAAPAGRPPAGPGAPAAAPRAGAVGTRLPVAHSGIAGAQR